MKMFDHNARMDQIRKGMMYGDEKTSLVPTFVHQGRTSGSGQGLWSLDFGMRSCV